MQPIPATTVFTPAEALLAPPPPGVALANAGLAPMPPSATSPPPRRGDGPLRSGNPRGNPNLAPRCGARARSGNPCRAPAMKNGRCRLHGGKCTGPRTPEGLARLAAAHTTHGMYCAGESRDALRHGKTLCRRMRITSAALRHLPWLPRALEARLATGPAELWAPPHYSHTRAMEAAARAMPRLLPGEVAVGGHDARGRFAPAPRPVLPRRAAERAAARVEAAALAPWRAGIARARMIKRLMLYQEMAARSAQRVRPGVGQEARGKESRQDPMNPGAVRAGGGSQDKAVPRLMAGTGPAMASCAAGAMRAGSVDGGSQDRAVPLLMAGARPAMTNCETGAVQVNSAVRPAMGAFRRLLLDSTETNQMAERAERAGDWTILIAIKAAQKAGQDWRPEVARLRKLNTENWLRARFMLRADGTDAIVVRLPQAPRPEGWGSVWGDA